MSPNNNLLIVGIDIVPILLSAKKAGYNVFAIDFFGDVDLKHVCDDSRSIIRQRRGESCGVFSRDFDAKLLLHFFKELIVQYEIQGVILGSGLEDSPSVLEIIHDKLPIIGNAPDQIATVRDKKTFFTTLHQLHVPCPHTRIAYDLHDVRRMAKDIGYPIVVKPNIGFGGFGIEKIGDQDRLEKKVNRLLLSSQGVLIQEYIRGTPGSVSTMSTRNNVAIVSINEQLLGLQEVGVQEPFGYCGNIVPLTLPNNIVKSCSKSATKVISHFALIGSNGIDFVVNESGCFVIEVNPRFQGSMECIERVYGMNLLHTHIEACRHNKLPFQVPKNPELYCTRLILYAPQTLVIPNLGRYQGLRDRPLEGVILEAGEPVCSILSEDSTREKSLENSLKKANNIYEHIHAFNESQRRTKKH